MKTSSISSTSSTAEDFYVIRVNPSGYMGYGDKGVYLSRESAQAYADKVMSWGLGYFTYEVYSAKELNALMDKGITIYSQYGTMPE